MLTSGCMHLHQSHYSISKTSSYEIASQFCTTRLPPSVARLLRRTGRRFSTLANLLLLDELGDLLKGPNLVQCPFIGVLPATGGPSTCSGAGWQLHVAIPICPFGPGKRLLSPSNARKELNSDEKRKFLSYQVIKTVFYNRLNNTE